MSNLSTCKNHLLLQFTQRWSATMGESTIEPDEDEERIEGARASIEVRTKGSQASHHVADNGLYITLS